MQKFNVRISPTQKSHYFVIMVTALWSVLTSLPYYILNAYFFLFKFHIFSFMIDLRTVKIMQIILALLFNANRCVNFFMYFAFHREFRACFIKLFFPICCSKVNKKNNVSNKKNPLLSIILSVIRKMYPQRFKFKGNYRIV